MATRLFPPLLLLTLLLLHAPLTEEKQTHTCSLFTVLGGQPIGKCGVYLSVMTRTMCNVINNGWPRGRRRRPIGRRRRPIGRRRRPKGRGRRRPKGPKAITKRADTAQDAESPGELVPGGLLPRDVVLSKRQAASYLQSKQPAIRKRTTYLTSYIYYPWRVQRRRGFQGMACECCFNSCTITELLDYC
ncbi:hypothetical protein ACOMHN_020735 [Nucella lapillus]